MKYYQKYRRQGNLTTYCSDTAMTCITRIQLRDGQKAASSLFPKKGDFGIAKNCRSINFTSVVAKIYNALLLNHIVPEIEKILSKNQNGFLRK